MNNNPKNAQEIFEQALEVADEAARRAYLDQACGGDATLRQEVESLLAANSAAGEFLQHPAQVGAGAAQRTMLIPPLSEKTGTRIGRYKLLEQIGEGGFGVVWMAEQEEPVRRRVALKIIKLGMDTKEVVARFEAERQALAMMDHPNIASVFDGGATETGRPYFVMELVKGVPITEYCDAKRLSTRERLDLFMDVCRAVQHAHQKGIIHRDIKPSNVLVTVKEDRPVPKVIDFGVAKATQARLTEKTVFTRFHQWIGTPAYMSPEQAGLASLDVDTRSDVYSLGVLLYELLTGHTPFDTSKLLKNGFEAVMRTIREEEPPKPSTRLSTLAEEELSTVAAQRGSEPAKLGRVVRGDLDWIVMKALEKDRQRRYETAAALAQDVARHLCAEPVSAAAPSFLYRAGKFTRRNRTRLSFAGLATVAVLLAVAGVKSALDSKWLQRTFLSTSTNAVFALARSGDAKALARLLDANPRLVSKRDEKGDAPLSHAAATGNTGALTLLISRGAAVDATNQGGLTALGSAAANNQEAALAVLLEAGADPNHADAVGATALHMASLFGSVEMARVLIAKGARLDAVVMASRVTALHQAAMLGYADLVELLLTNGASVSLRDSADNTPLHSAASGMSAVGSIRDWQERLVSRLSSNADNEGFGVTARVVSNLLASLETSMLSPAVQRAGGQHRRVAELLLAYNAALELANRDGCTPLLMAALYTNVPVAEVLVAHRANLNARARDGSLPLSLVALKGSAPIADLLLKAGANPDMQDNAGFTPLNTAIEQDHPDVAKLLAERGANPNLATRSGQTPLHTAAARGDLASMRLLLDHGAALHPLENAGTPLSVAVQHHQVEAVKFLLQCNAKPDVAPPQNGMTSLHWAAILGQPDIVKLLLDAGAKVDADSSLHGTPLNAAASGRKDAQKWLASAYAQFPSDAKLLHPVLGSESDYVAVLRTLLAAKANVNAREPRYGRTPIFAAVSLGQAGAVGILLAAEADMKAQDRQGLTPLHAASEMEAPEAVVSNIVTCLLRARADVDARDYSRATPLHAAANSGKPVMVALLLEAGAQINAVGPNLCTPLQLAVMGGRHDVVELLLGHQPYLEWRNISGTTALLQAAQLQSRDLVALLLDHGAEVDYPDINGATALMVSASIGDLDTVKLLLQRGARVDATYKNGYTAFLGAAQEGKVESARYLLEQRAQFDVRDNTGNTPLLLAARNGHLEMVNFLLDRGAKIEVKNDAGFTAIHEAADRGHAHIVEILLNRGATLEPRDDYQSTPLHVAAHGAFADEARYVAVIKVLLSHGANVNGRMRGNQTPLHGAATWGRPKILQALLAAGADATARDDSGRTVLDITKDRADPKLSSDVAAGRKECEKLLQAQLNPPVPSLEE